MLHINCEHVIKVTIRMRINQSFIFLLDSMTVEWAAYSSREFLNTKIH